LGIQIAVIALYLYFHLTALYFPAILKDVMNTSISKARQSLFALVDLAAKGEKVEFVHKGQVFQIVPVDRPSKLARLKPMNVLPEGTTFDDLEHAQNDLSREVALAWEHNNAQ
jgi:antitoxin (DNA-binding transcriptional repressor) of toxin-antitoxin stability system